MDYKLKLGATLSFSGEQERDIVVQLESLKKRHKLGEFISASLRVIFENPEFAKEHGLSLGSYGLSDNRQEFFNAVTKKVNEMNTKVDEIYKMALQTYTLATFNKRIGVDDKSKNILMAQFILQKQMAEMCRILGVDTMGNSYEANKLFDVSKNVEDMVEFIINYYDGIASEIKTSISGDKVRDTGISHLESKIAELEKQLSEKQTEITKVMQEVKSVNGDTGKSTKDNSNTVDEDNKVLDFGIPEAEAFDAEQANMANLLNIFGI